MSANRREFLKDAAFLSGAAIAAGTLGQSIAQAAPTPDWKKQVGLELFSVRAEMAKDFEGVLASLASFGYKEVEPASGFNNMEPKAFRAMLERYGLSVPSTHNSLTPGPDFEKKLEGYQIMGIQYTRVTDPPVAAPAGGRGGPRPPATEESVKRVAQNLNDCGKIAKKFGIKTLFHNHTEEFELLENSQLTQYDVLVRETNPEFVAMQLDIGWASVAQQNILEMFKKNPGRYELWHVKDAVTKALDPKMTNQAQRHNAAELVPIGLGDVDYSKIFAGAELAGLKHFCIEQDNANQWGNAVAACQASISGLIRKLS